MNEVTGTHFRRAAGSFASGVTVVATAAPSGHYGVTVSSFVSLSLSPLLITVSINRASPFAELVRSCGAFAVSVLAKDQQSVAGYFSTRGRLPEPGGFGGVSAVVRSTGAPVMEDCLSWFDCTLEDILPGGDHEILIGRVAAAGGNPGEPLVYWSGAYRSIGQTPAPAAADELDSDPALALANAADSLSVALHVLDVGAQEMIAAQSVVEPALAALAATNGTAGDWSRLDDLIDQSQAAADAPAEFNELALNIHDLIARAAQNRILHAALVSLRQIQTHHYRELGSAQKTAQETIDEHRGLAAVLRSGDSERAADVMRQHIDQLGHRIGLPSQEGA